MPFAVHFAPDLRLALTLRLRGDTANPVQCISGQGVTRGDFARAELCRRRYSARCVMSASSRVQVDERRAAPIPHIRSLRFPGEQWRFVLAAVASVVFLVLLLALFLSQGVTALVGLLALLIVTVASVWCTIQIARARLLGNCVKVTPTMFPELQAILDEVRHQLDYQRRIDVYVAEKTEPSVNLVTYLGTHIILIEGDFAAELLEPSKTAQLRFLIARHVGALKARQFRLDLLVVMLTAANALQFVKPFLMPYYRATAYSGDQIGLACCGGLEAALEATGRLLVGKELAPQLPLGGVLPQAALVKERLLPRFAQFLSPAPHVINRYLNLLLYARALDVDAWNRVCGRLGPAEAHALEELWMASPHRERADGVSSNGLGTAVLGTAPTQPAQSGEKPTEPLTKFPPPRPTEAGAREPITERVSVQALDFAPPAFPPPNTPESNS